MSAEARMAYFRLLTFDEQIAAIQRLAKSGVGADVIASATGMAVEQIRRILGAPECDGCGE
jgi:hypothetical protein